MQDFLSKLKQAADAKFDSPVMPKSVKLFRNTVPGPDTGPLLLLIAYEDMAAYGARTTFENANPEWRALFACASQFAGNVGFGTVADGTVTRRKPGLT